MSDKAASHNVVASRRQEAKKRRESASLSIAAELRRHELIADVTMGNTLEADIECTSKEGTKSVYIKVKTCAPGRRTCIVGMKAEKDFGDKFFWVIAGKPSVKMDKPFEYYIIPSRIMAEKVREEHQLWLQLACKNGQKHRDNRVRIAYIPPSKFLTGWDISDYRDKWDLIEDEL